MNRRTRRTSGLIIVLAIATAALTGCAWMGYTAYIGSWTMTSEQDDGSGGVMVVSETFSLAQGSYTNTLHLTFEDDSEQEQRLRGELLVIGHTMTFTVRDISFDETTMLLYELLFAFAGETFALSGQEWMDVDEFIAEMARIGMELSRDDVEIGTATFEISDGVLSLIGDDWEGDYARQ